MQLDGSASIRRFAKICSRNAIQTSTFQSNPTFEPDNWKMSARSDKIPIFPGKLTLHFRETLKWLFCYIIARARKKDKAYNLTKLSSYKFQFSCKLQMIFLSSTRPVWHVMNVYGRWTNGTEIIKYLKKNTKLSDAMTCDILVFAQVQHERITNLQGWMQHFSCSVSTLFIHYIFDGIQY